MPTVKIDPHALQYFLGSGFLEPCPSKCGAYVLVGASGSKANLCSDCLPTPTCIIEEGSDDITTACGCRYEHDEGFTEVRVFHCPPPVPMREWLVRNILLAMEFKYSLLSEAIADHLLGNWATIAQARQQGLKPVVDTEV